MARDARVEELLHRWAAAVTVGDGSGYASVNVLHPNWTPPSPGQSATLKAAPITSDVLRVHAAVGRLSLKQRNAVVMHYVLRPALSEQCERLGCELRTLYARIEAAHAVLRYELFGSHAASAF